jgi:hypothetical protein
MTITASGSDSLSNDAAPSCAVCGGQVNATSNTCTRCGAKADRIGRCSQCHAISAVQPHNKLVWQCSVCGAARLTQEKCEAAEDVQQSLRDATRAHRLAGVSRLMAIVGATIGLVGIMLVVAIKTMFSSGEVVTGALLALPVFALILSLVGMLKTKDLAKTRTQSLDRAYSLAMMELLSKTTPGETAGQFADALAIESEKAAHLLAGLNVRDDVGSEVTDEGQITYFARGSQQAAATAGGIRPVTERLRLPDTVPADSNPEDVPGPDVKTQISSVAKT